MKQIIKHGHAPYKATCPLCGCIFTFEDEDIENNHCQWDYEEWLSCPECEQHITVINRADFRNFPQKSSFPA